MQQVRNICRRTVCVLQILPGDFVQIVHDRTPPSRQRKYPPFNTATQDVLGRSLSTGSPRSTPADVALRVCAWVVTVGRAWAASERHGAAVAAALRVWAEEAAGHDGVVGAVAP